MSRPVEALREALGTTPSQATRQAATGIEPWAVIQGGLAGWAGMTALMWGARLAGVTQVDLIDFEGSFLARRRSAEAESVGFFTHLGMSVGIAFLYAFGFKWLRLRPDWRSGLFASLIHWLIAATVVGLASEIHPRRSQLRMPGFGGFARGPFSGLGFFVDHVVYGTLVGRQYGAWPGRSR